MAQFTRLFFEKIIDIEQGYQADPDDVGNYACGQLIGTNMGISAIALQEYLGRCPTVADSKGITPDFAWQFYNWYFGKKSRYLEVEDQQTAELLMNNHMGAPKYAAQAAQRAMNRFGFGLVVDGLAGSKTIAAINDAVRQNRYAAYNAIREEWVDYLQTGTNPKFRQGLLNRMALHFPPLLARATDEDAYADIKAGSAEYQAGRVKAVFAGAFQGNPKDMLAVFGLFAGMFVLALAFFKLTASNPAPI